MVFAVKSGAGKLWATHSGDPASDMGKNPAHGDTRPAYHGLVRAYIRSASDNATSSQHRRRLREIDLDGGVVTAVADPALDGRRLADAKANGRTEGIMLDGIVVTATVKACAGKPGCPSDTLTIPLTTDLAQLPKAVAARPAEANSMVASKQ